MPKWIHDRADHLMTKNPEMPKSQAFAIATQQSYAAGKAPKGYGTPHGRHEAYDKYDDPKSTYEKKADPKTKTSSAFWTGFADELVKIALAVTPADVMKGRGTPTLTSRPKLTSRPTVREPTSGGISDPLESSRIAQPPPVTAGGI